MTRVAAALDPARLRQVYGAFPTGVAALAAVVDGAPVGLAASSFTAVSLEPALVSVCIAHTSTTWPVLRTARKLGVSVLAAGQGAVGAQLADRSSDRFAGLPWRTTTDDAVVVDGASAWLETSIEAEHEAGDHDIVVLQVHDLAAHHGTPPLVFHRSRFRRLSA